MDLEFKLLPHQLNFVKAKERFVLNSGGVGSGKTFSLIVKAIELIFEYPGIFGVIGAQTFPLVRNTVLRDFVSMVPEQAIKNYNKQTSTFKFHNGSEVIFMPFDDPTKLKSLNLGFGAIIESTDVDEEIFRMMRTRLRQEGMPCQLFMDTNPSGYGSWVYKSFFEEKSRLKNSKVIQSISVDNKHLPEEYIEDLKSMAESDPEFYKRMVEGKWGSVEGLIYDLTDKHIIKDSPICERFIAGIDFGYTHPTAIVILGVVDGKYYIVDEWYEYKKTSSEIIAACAEFQREYRIDVWYADWARPEIIEDMNREDLYTVGADKSVFDGIMYVKSLLREKRLYVLEKCKYTRREFNSYVWDKRNTVKEVPLKINDHGLDATRYAIFTDSRIGQPEAFEYDFA